MLHQVSDGDGNESSPTKRPRQDALSYDVLLGKSPVKKTKSSAMPTRSPNSSPAASNSSVGPSNSSTAPSSSADTLNDVFGPAEPLRKSNRSRKGKQKENGNCEE
ncbi:hypothetical protein I350_05148 [Cryptococcus amylolentus CBS 6273]|uniref:Uncharacterized protein n=1 Tax=Cryptococcus amylolentus CBS 6273 TaxID=1296118 RepID=A0A1E3JUM8_9TREE|nr:hypothetical protein I350_05148 [Cryptococcus amylolentus CBS 6273]